MKLRELITNVDKSEQNEDWYGYIDDSMISSLGLGCMGVYQIEGKPRLQCYWVSKWLCSDTHCGIRAFFLDNEFIGIATQRARRDDVVFEYISNTVKAKLRAYIMELTDYGEHDEEETMLDLDREMGDGFKVNWKEELIDTEVMVGNTSVQVIGRSATHKNSINIIMNGVEDVVDVRDVTVPYHLREVSISTTFTPEMIEYFNGIGWKTFNVDSAPRINDLSDEALVDIYIKQDEQLIVVKTKTGIITYAVLEWDTHGYYFKTPSNEKICLGDVIGYVVEY